MYELLVVFVYVTIELCVYIYTFTIFWAKFADKITSEHSMDSLCSEGWLLLNILSNHLQLEASLLLWHCYNEMSFFRKRIYI